MNENHTDGHRESAVPVLVGHASGLAAGLTGTLMQVKPELHALGIGLASASSIVAHVAATATGRVQLWLNERSGERVEEAAAELQARLEEAGLTDRWAEIKDLWARAIPIVADDELKAKRDLIRELMVQTAGRDDRHTAHYEAAVAMKVIGDLPGSAVVLLGWLFRDAQVIRHDLGPGVVIDNDGAYRGMDRQMFWPDIEELKKPLLVEYLQNDSKFYIYLNHRGLWLKKMIENRELD